MAKAYVLQGSLLKNKIFALILINTDIQLRGGNNKVIYHIFELKDNVFLKNVDKLHLQLS